MNTSTTVTGLKEKIRGGINRIKKKSERYKEADALRSARKLWLEAGWNPIIDPKFKNRPESQPSTEIDKQIQSEEAEDPQTVNELQQMGTPKALDYALGKKKLATKSRSGYKSCLKYIKAAIEKLRWTNLPISALKRFHVKKIMSQLSKDRQLTPHV